MTSDVQGQASLSARDADQHLLAFRSLCGRENRIAMDDRPSQDPYFACPATAGATSERNLDAGVLQTIQQVLGCPDVDRLARELADRLERLIALPGPGAEALDVNSTPPASRALPPR